MKVLMVGVDKSTKGGMWTVVENYLHDRTFCKKTHLKYIPTSITGKTVNKLLFTLVAYLKILYTFMTAHIDIVHVHMSERGSVYRKGIVLKTAKMFHCKTVIHMHGAEFQVWYEQLSDEKKEGVKKILNLADKMIILGDYWYEFISSLVDKDKIEIVHNAVNVPDIIEYNPNSKNIMFLGVVGKRKGIDDLLDAMKEADKQLGDDVKLYIYGPNPDHDIGGKINYLQLSDRVEYKGWLSANEKGATFKSIAVNVLPSYNEGLPMTILETMAYGIVNISTDVAAIPEAVNEKNGILIKPGDIKALSDAIITLMNNDELRKEKSYASYQDAKTLFSLETHVAKVMKIYERLGNS